MSNLHAQLITSKVSTNQPSLVTPPQQQKHYPEQMTKISTAQQNESIHTKQGSCYTQG